MSNNNAYHRESLASISQRRLSTVKSKSIYVLPNAFTAAALFSAFYGIIAAMNDLGRFGLVDTAIVRRDLMDGEESVLAIRDNWEVADFDACEWSDPTAADPYICVVYDLRRLAEDEDGKPRRMKGTMRYDTHYSLSGFDYLTFPDA